MTKIYINHNYLKDDLIKLLKDQELIYIFINNKM